MGGRLFTVICLPWWVGGGYYTLYMPPWGGVGGVHPSVYASLPPFVGASPPVHTVLRVSQDHAVYTAGVSNVHF